MTNIAYSPARPRFPDVSHWHVVGDWGALRASLGANPVMGFKGLQDSFVDPQAATNRQRCIDEGIKAVVYDFGIGKDGRIQAEAFLRAYPPRDGAAPGLDFEHNPAGASMTIGEAVAWVTTIRSAWGRYPVFYGHSTWIAQGQPEGTIISQCWYWGPEYGSTLIVPRGVGLTFAHQYSNGVAGPLPHSMAGVGYCDMNSLLVPFGVVLTMMGQAATPVPAPGPAWPHEYLKLGSHGPNVKTWKTQLTKRGWKGMDSTDVFGSATNQATRGFQANNNLFVDGIVGELTWGRAWA